MRLLVAWLFLLAAFSPALSQADPLTDPSPPEVIFSDAIQAKVDELGGDPVRIYEFVRNDLEYQAYWGLMKGPEGALVSGGGNDYDLSALLVSMLRASGHRARFVRGRVRIPAVDAISITGAAGEEVIGEYPKNYWANLEPEAWSDPEGEPEKGASWDATAKTVERWNVWVEAEVPLADYRGSSGGAGGLAWVPLDVAMKVMEFDLTEVIQVPLGGDVSFDYDSEEGLYRSADTRDVVEILEDQIQEWLADNEPGKTLEDISVRSPVKRLEAGVLPTALPYPIVDTADSLGADSLRGATLAEVHGSEETWVYEAGLFLCDADAGLTANDCRDKGWAYIDDGTTDPDLELAWSKPAPELEDKRVSLTFPPVNPGDVGSDGYVDCDGTLTRATVSIDATAVEFPGFNPQFPICGDVLAVVSARLPEQIAFFATVDSDHFITAGGIFVPHFDFHGSGSARTRRTAEVLLEAEQRLPILYDGEFPYVDYNDNQAFDADSEKYLGADFTAREELVGGLLELASVRWAERVNSDHAKLAGYHHRLNGRLPRPECYPLNSGSSTFSTRP